MNWYRVLSSLIDEALKRGHDVECWHNAGVKGLGENLPSLEKVPLFRFGQPKVIEYFSHDEFISNFKHKKINIFVDSFSPDMELSNLLHSNRIRFVLLPTHGHLPYCIKNKDMLLGCDLISVNSGWTEIELFNLVKRDVQSLLVHETEYLADFGKIFSENFKKLVRRLIGWEYDPESVEYLSRHIAVVGIPSFDSLKLINKKEVKERWGIQEQKKVVVLLPSPYDMPRGLFYGDLFMAGSLFSRLSTVIKYREINKLNSVFNKGFDKNVIKGIRRFCDRNNACLVVKLRHSREPQSYLKEAADIIVSDDSFYPHTALEAYSVADLTIGFYSTGVLEAIAAGSPYLNIEIPFFPKDFWFNHLKPIQQYIWDHDGVVWSFEADEVVDKLPDHSINDFKIDETQREQYLKQYIGHTDYNSSEVLMDRIEDLLTVDRSKNYS